MNDNSTQAGCHMILPEPRSYLEIITDGAIAQETVDDYFRFCFSPNDPVEFNRRSTDVEIRLTDRRGETHIKTGIVVAEKAKYGGWTWTEDWLESVENFGLPQLAIDAQPTRLSLKAARTLCGNGVLLHAPGYDVILPPEIPWHTERESLLVGLPKIPHWVDKQRAILAHSVFWESDLLTLSETSARLADGTELTFDDEGITSVSGDLSVEDVLADAWYYAYEHELFLASVMPDCRLSATDKPDTYRLTASNGRTLTCTGADIGSLYEDFEWNWGESGRETELSTRTSYLIRNFAVEHGIAPLLKPQLTREEYKRWQIPRLICPIINKWICLELPISESHSHLIALDLQSLQLPAVTDDILSAVSQGPLPESVNKDRAWNAYKKYRGLVAHF